MSGDGLGGWTKYNKCPKKGGAGMTWDEVGSWESMRDENIVTCEGFGISGDNSGEGVKSKYAICNEIW